MKKKTIKPRKPKNRAKVYAKKAIRGASNPEFNMNHPEIKDAIEYAFTCGTKNFYRFKDEREIPAGRYQWVDEFLKEHEIRMSLPVLQGYVQAMKDCMKATSEGFDLHKINVILHKMETRTNLAFNIDTIKRLASVVYFDETENLMLYDSDYGQKKIKLWEMHDFIAFFLQTPIKELLQLEGISETSLRNFMETQSQVLRDLTLNPSTSSEAST